MQGNDTPAFDPSRFHPEVFETHELAPADVPAVLYHGGAPGFRPGDLILPAPTHRVDGCAWCASGREDSHRPDRVFASEVRLYSKFYASKYVRGWLYRVEPTDDPVESVSERMDLYASYQSRSFRVVAVLERAVEFTNSERRRIWRVWKDRDARLGFAKEPTFERVFEAQIGIRPPGLRGGRRGF